MNLVVLTLLIFGVLSKCPDSTSLEHFEWSTDLIIEDDDALVTKLHATKDGDLIVAIENLNKEVSIARMNT